MNSVDMKKRSAAIRAALLMRYCVRGGVEYRKLAAEVQRNLCGAYWRELSMLVQFGPVVDVEMARVRQIQRELLEHGLAAEIMVDKVAQLGATPLGADVYEAAFVEV